MDWMKKQMTTLNVLKLWSLKDSGQIEALVGPYKLYDASFRTLCGHGWLSDEILDAYLHLIVEKGKIPIYRMDAVIGSSLFHLGQHRAFRKMAFPEASIWLCPVNVGGHWILVLVRMDHKEVIVIDPLGHERTYQRRILRNWRNFLRAKDARQGNWKVKTLPHGLQPDASSCGVLILRFAESFLQVGDLQSVSNGPAQMFQDRMDIATKLLQCKDKVEAYCVSCNMLHYDTW
nr:uncharacterized protein LOC129160815 isoform X1 [Nothobranchius furzeri]XP_054593811.1 uncharacterized protein LOC129160815 isoform X1 [Nothobranchius furzeri]